MSGAEEPAARALALALATDPFYAALVAPFAPDDAHAALVAYFTRSLRRARRSGRLVTLDDATLGAAIWSIPDDATVDASAQGPSEAGTGHQQSVDSSGTEPADGPDDLTLFGAAGARLYAEVIEFMGPRTAPLVPAQAWYLSILGVDPERQGGGLGRRLLEPTLAEAGRVGRTCYLETFSADNVAFYERLGFNELALVDVPGTPLAYRVMATAP